MILRPFLYEPTACASYLFGCPANRRDPSNVSTPSRSRVVVTSS
jgi:hypothetical protein